MKGKLPDDDRAAVSYVDVIMTTGTLVMIAAIAPMIFAIYEMLDGVVDPLTQAIIALIVPLFIIGLIISMGVSARS